jgi:coenzyme PQQ synthesis protein D (PqqD)
MRADDLQMTRRQRARVVAQQAAGQWVLLDVDSGRYYALDEVGGRIWHLCDGSRTVAQIAEVVGDEYDVEGAPVQEDVAAFVSELVSESLLV